MPLNRPAHTLGNGPRGVQEARRWVVSAFVEIDRSELAECAEVGISELVTNALLHAEGRIQVRVRGTREHPRVEVLDASTEPPLLPTNAPDGDDVLLTFGRGLSIVARSSEAWGADIDDDGKVVWFTPSAEFSDVGPDGQITGHALGDATAEHATDPISVELCDVPLADYIAFHHHFRGLRREVRLLALAHEADYPLAKHLSEVFTAHGRTLAFGAGSDAVTRAQQSGAATVDLHLKVGRRAARDVGRFIDLLELTDAFGREEKLLSLARTPAQREFQNWFLGEFVSQAEDAAPRRWTGSVDRATRTSVS